MDRTPADPYCAFRFVVDLAATTGGSIGGFTDVSGLGAETEVETVREGGWNTGEHQLTGGTRFPSRLVLRRGLGDPALLWNWYLQIMAGSITRKPLTIKVCKTDGRPGLSWTFREACPVKWTGPELHAATSAVAFESIEVVHRGLLLSGTSA